jgi:aminopeptidase-like protein
MANNELSGPVVTTFLTKWLLDMPVREFNYRIIFIPETIGSIFYLSKSLEHMKENVLAGFNLTCLGDDGHYSFVSSRAGNTLADSCIEHVLKHSSSEFKKYDFLRRGSDERQYCSPGVDLPLITLCRSKFHEYPEYHTSLDNLEFISEEGLAGSLTVLQKAVLALEMNRTLTSVHKCEPFLGKYDLYPKLSTKKTPSDVALIVDLLTYSDGKNTLLDIANIINRPIWELYETKENLRTNGLIKESKIQ